MFEFFVQLIFGPRLSMHQLYKTQTLPNLFLLAPLTQDGAAVVGVRGGDARHGQPRGRVVDVGAQHGILTALDVILSMGRMLDKWIQVDIVDPFCDEMVVFFSAKPSSSIYKRHLFIFLHEFVWLLVIFFSQGLGSGQLPK